MHPTESQPLLSHHDLQDMTRPLLPYPLLLTLLLLSIFLLPYIFDRPATSTTHVKHSNNLHLRAASRNSTINLLSLNSFIRPKLVGWNDYKDQRLQDLLQPLLQKDLLCLQELFWTSGKRKQLFLDKLSNNLPYAAHAPKPQVSAWLRFPPKPIDAGLAILSTRKIVATSFHMFSVSAWNTVDAFVAKGVLYAGIQVASSVVHVFTTHMQAGDFPEVRRRQIRELVNFVKRVVTDDGIILIAGDFNVDGRRGYDDDGDSENYVAMMRRLADVGVKDVMKEHIGQVVTTAGGLWGLTQKNERIDYFLMNSGSGKHVASVGDVRVEQLRVEGREYRTMSDHYAVVAEILVALR